MIDAFQGEYRFLSNFYKSALLFEGEIYPTVEHVFQAAKTDDAEERAAIRANANPVIAKRKGRKVTLRADWEEVKRDTMLKILRIKFADAELAAKLAATGMEELIEGNRWHDRYWGKCQCAKCGGEGLNILGEALMQVRGEIAGSRQQALTTNV